MTVTSRDVRPGNPGFPHENARQEFVVRLQSACYSLAEVARQIRCGTVPDAQNLAAIASDVACAIVERDPAAVPEIHGVIATSPDFVEMLI